MPFLYNRSKREWPHERADIIQVQQFFYGLFHQTRLDHSVFNGVQQRE